MENRIRKKKSSKSIRPKLSKKKMAPFLVYPTIYYDGYLVLKNKNRENKHIENNSHANINRPSTAKEDHKKQQPKNKKLGQNYHHSYHINSSKVILPDDKKYIQYQYIKSIVAQKSRDTHQSQTFHEGITKNNGTCFTNNLLVQKIKQSTSFQASHKGQFLLKGKRKALVKERRSEKKEMQKNYIKRGIATTELNRTFLYEI